MPRDHTFIYPEMMVHPAFFIHAKVQKIAIIGQEAEEILQETLKHPNAREIWHPLPLVNDVRAKSYSNFDWLTNFTANYFDIIILNTAPNAVLLQHCFRTLHENGLLIQKSHSPFELPSIKEDQQQLMNTGFIGFQSLQFPMPSQWGTLLIASKKHITRHLSEKTIFNRAFKTQYYNFDIHKAALALPEFMRDEFEDAF